MKTKNIVYVIVLYFFSILFLNPYPVFALAKNNKTNEKISISNIKRLIYKNPVSAVKNIHIMIKKHPKNPKLYNYLGLAYGRLNNADKAIYYYKKAIRLNSKYLSAYNNLGLEYNKTRNFKNAYITFLKMVKLNPKNSVYYNNIGFIEEERNENHRAIEFFNKAIRINPFYTMAYLNIGSIYRRLGENRRAAREYNKSGLTYFKVGNYSQAVNSFKLSIKLYRRYVYPYENIANSYVKLGIIDKAVSYYTSSGNIYNNDHKYSNAVKEFNLALKYNSKYMPAVHGILIAYQRLGNMRMASRYMREEIRTDGIGAIFGGGLASH